MDVLTAARTILDLEEVACCICGDRAGRTCLEGRDVEFRTCANCFCLRECATCGHVYLSPRPRAEDLPVIYRNYLTTNAESAYSPSRPIAWVKDHLFDRPRLRPVLRELRPGGAVLDIGAGAGRLLLLLRRLSRVSVRLYANDIDFNAAAQARFAREDVHLLPGLIEHCRTPARFDAITGIHVLEHVSDPPAVLRWAYQHLRPGGVLYLETPDAGTVLRRLFGSAWGHTHFPRHFNLFDKPHLARLAAAAGFAVARHRNLTAAPVWNMSIRNLLGLDALTRRGPLDVFGYRSPVTLGLFTVIDFLLLVAGVTTSTQQLVAVRPATDAAPALPLPDDTPMAA